MVTASVREIDATRREIEVEAPVEEVERELDRAYREYQKDIQLPGFRKGKAPLSLIRARFGQAIQEEVFQRLIQKFYREAREQLGIEPLFQAQLGKVEYRPGERFRFTATVDVQPKLKVDYTGLRATRRSFRVLEENVDRWLEETRERHAQIRTVPREARWGDLVRMDVQSTDASGLPIIGHRREDVLVELGRSGLGREFEEQLLGARRGEERQVFLERQGPSGNPVRAGYRVVVREVYEKTLPELDDEFARDEGYASLEEMRSAVREYLQHRLDDLSRQELRAEILNQLLDRNPVPVPERLVERYLDALTEEMRREGEEVNEEVRRESRSRILREIKARWILKAIAEQEGVAVSDEEVEEVVRLRARSEGRPFESLKRAYMEGGGWERIRDDILEEKVWDFLESRAQIEELQVSPDYTPILVPS
ncbi:MAG: trigger factor [Candidatus Latescibacterota bacterium]|nr:MAG: trigger factor [Candidatus Latescibacterota bacterium]